ncbi:MAG: GNAT family N-acetyltransferase [Candidatus Babeliales bacterium]|nr:GNAT family N-acetyltransferase [Candidatus Babeliales bacterium]
MKTILSFLVLLITHLITYSENIIIRPAIKDDFEKLMIVDKKISYEYFKPIFLKYYSELPFGKDPDQYLELDLKQDEIYFNNYIQDPNKNMINLAWDKNNKNIAGMTFFHKEDNILHIDLLLVDKDYRNMKIGRKLLNSAINFYKDIKTCLLYTLRFGNESTHKFYKAMGFKCTGIRPGKESKFIFQGYPEVFLDYKLELS